jgi:hypothetical protein
LPPRNGKKYGNTRRPKGKAYGYSQRETNKKEIKKEGKPLVCVELMDNIIILHQPYRVK